MVNKLEEFEIDLDSLINENGCVEDWFYLQDLKDRKLYINDEIDESNASYIMKKILHYNREDGRNGIAIEDRKPIIVFISTYGGGIDPGIQLIDFIRYSETPVYTVNTSYCFSMGFIIMLAGHKRFAMRNSRFLCHDGSNYVYNSAEKVLDYMEFNQRTDERMKKYIIERSNITEEMYESNKRKEWYMFADEAKELGVIDGIIGIDVSLGEII